jgi:hypothetical protein
MDDGFVFHALTAFLLDHRGTFGGLTFLDDGSAVTVAIPIIVPMAFVDRHAGANRANLNANLVRQSRGSQRGNGRNHQSVLHLNLLSS